MSKQNIRIIFLLAVINFLTVNGKFDSSGGKIRLINIVFRHGDRIPLRREFYKSDPNKNRTIDPPGYGHETNKGKLRAYTLGRTINEYFGRDAIGADNVYKHLYAITTNVDRTKVTLQSVLGGMYPPEGSQIWNKNLTKWQPIPFQVAVPGHDHIFEGTHCELYKAERHKVSRSPQVEKERHKFSGLMHYLTNKTGESMMSMGRLFNLYHLWEAEESLGWPLPDFSKGIFPEGQLADAATFVYNLESYNSRLKSLNGGILLSRMIADMKKAKKHKSYQLKVKLYSAHETHVAAMLESLNFEATPPYYTSAVALVLVEKNSEYFVKVLHYLGSRPVFEEKTIKGCDKLCPLEKFSDLLKKNLPTKDEIACKTN